MFLLNQTSSIRTPIEKGHLQLCKRYLQVNNKACSIACWAELGRYPLIFDTNKRIHSISYRQSKEQSSLVIQALVMSSDLHRNGKTSSFYTNRIKMLNYYSIPFYLNNDNLNDSEIMGFVDHIQKNYFTYWKHPVCNSQKLEFYRMFLKKATHH